MPGWTIVGQCVEAARGHLARLAHALERVGAVEPDGAGVLRRRGGGFDVIYHCRALAEIVFVVHNAAMPGSSIAINGLGVIYGVAPCPVILPCALAPPIFLPSSLIPVLVTGIQPRRVCAVNDLPFLDEELEFIWRVPATFGGLCPQLRISLPFRTSPGELALPLGTCVPQGTSGLNSGLFGVSRVPFLRT
jgi:hypothetical protein